MASVQMDAESEFYDTLHQQKYRDSGQTFDEHAGMMAYKMASDESHRDQLEDLFFYSKFLPAGRVQAAMGASEREVSAFNCSVSRTIEDDMSSIMAAASESAGILRLGTGIGYNFSNIRPRGALIKSLQTEASGPVSFMQIFEAVASTIASSGHRRGAQMAVLNVDHPDIEAFIDCKMVKGAFRQFNISVGITDDFMYALENGGDYALHHNGVIYATVPADRIWTKIMRNAYESAEPGILFIDRINKQNNLSYCETIEATNPCAEQPLPPHGLCLLGSFNLTRYMAADKIDVNALVADVPAIVEAYDNIFDASVYAIPEHEREAQSKRRMGIGLTGIANAIEYTTKSPYGSPKFCNEFERVAKALRNALYRASINLAKERGAFSLFDADYYGKSPFIRSLPEDIQEDIQIHGVRNSHLISYAPCGTISQVAGNISSGVEPVFFHTANRDVHMREGKRSVTLHDHNVKVHGYYGRTLNECSVEDHIAVGKIAQRYCDSSVSKTVNVAASCSYDDYERIYREAYFHGLKGVTVFRPTELRGAVITEAKKEKSFRYGEVQCSNGECSV